LINALVRLYGRTFEEIAAARKFIRPLHGFAAVYNLVKTHMDEVVDRLQKHIRKQVFSALSDVIT